MSSWLKKEACNYLEYSEKEWGFLKAWEETISLIAISLLVVYSPKNKSKGQGFSDVANSIARDVLCHADVSTLVVRGGGCWEVLASGYIFQWGNTCVSTSQWHPAIGIDDLK